MNQPSVKKNTVFNIIKTLSTIIFPLITFPYISRILHAENIGKINFGASIVSYVSLIASLGVTTYAVRECSKVRFDQNRLNETASQIISINIISTCIAYIALFLLLLFWKSVLNYRILILIQSLSILFATLGADWLNTAMEDFKYITIRTFVFQLIALIAMFVFVHKPEHYLVYAIISIISSSGGNIVNIFYRRKYCKIHLTLKIEWSKHLPPIILLFAMILSQTIFVNVDTTMLGIMRSDFEVGLYSTSTKIYSMVNQVVASIAWVVMPQLSYYFPRKDYKEINHLLKYSFNFIIILGLPAVVGLFIMAPEIIEMIGGREYLGAVTSLRILSVALAFSFVGGFVGNIIFLPSKREKICLISCLIGALVNFLANLFLIPIYGLNAAAFTTALSQAIVFFIGLPFIEKEIDLGNKFKLLISPFLGCIAIVGVVLLVKKFISGLWLHSFVAILLSALVYVFVLIILKNEVACNMMQSVIKKIKGSLFN